MLRSVTDLRGYTLSATDGDIGTVADLYFDDEAWAMRYLVVDTGTWLSGRQVLISPVAIHQADWVSRRLPVSLSRQRVKDSPSIDTAQPVSRQKEAEYVNYFGYPAYWHGEALWGAGAYPYPIGAPVAPVAAAVPPPPVPAGESASTDTHLRSAREVTGYHLHASDGALGHVEDFLVDDLDWAIRYMVADTSNWWFGRKVLVAPEWIIGIDWLARQMHVEVTREEMKQAPTYDSVGHVNRQWESDYYRQHKRPPYWISAARARAIKTRHESIPARPDDG